MLRPSNATLRPNSSERLMICCSRCTEELKQEMNSRRSARLKTSPCAVESLARNPNSPDGRIGRIGKQQQHAAAAVIGQRVQIEELVVGGRRVDLEIAGVDHDAEGVVIASATAFTIECVTWMNSI